LPAVVVVLCVSRFHGFRSGRLRPGEQLLSRSALEKDALHRILLPLAVWPDQREDWMGVLRSRSSHVLASGVGWLRMR
jgi:hypothetical protein